MIGIVVASILIFPTNKQEKKKEKWIQKVKKEYDYAIDSYGSRYKDYQQQNPNLTKEQIIKQLNI